MKMEHEAIKSLKRLTVLQWGRNRGANQKGTDEKKAEFSLIEN